MYQEIQPHPLLRPYIETYWMSEDYAEDGDEFSLRVMPDGCVDIIFTFEEGLLIPLLVGTMTSYQDVSYKGKVKIGGIRFRPGVIKAFVHTPVFEYTDMKINMQNVDTLLEKALFEKLQNAQTMKQLFLSLDKYLLTRLPYFIVLDRQIDYTVKLLEHAGGNIPATILAEKACLSLRQFERRFKESVGISPKAFSRIIRFRRLSMILANNPDQSLFDIAFNCGYHDHSHLSKEFKRLSGHTPKGF